MADGFEHDIGAATAGQLSHRLDGAAVARDEVRRTESERQVALCGLPVHCDDALCIRQCRSHNHAQADAARSHYSDPVAGADVALVKGRAYAGGYRTADQRSDLEGHSRIEHRAARLGDDHVVGPGRDARVVMDHLAVA